MMCKITFLPTTTITNCSTSHCFLLQSEFEKRARAMADGDEEPLTENEKHALRNSTVTEDGRHVCGKTRRVEGQPMILLTLTHLAGDEVSWILSQFF